METHLKIPEVGSDGSIPWTIGTREECGKVVHNVGQQEEELTTREISEMIG